MMGDEAKYWLSTWFAECGELPSACTATSLTGCWVGWFRRFAQCLAPGVNFDLNAHRFVKNFGQVRSVMGWLGQMSDPNVQTDTPPSTHPVRVPSPRATSAIFMYSYQCLCSS